MIEQLYELIAKHRKAGLLIDTNLLLLWFVGQFNPQRIAHFAPLHLFNDEDYLLLLDVVNEFDRLITTPNILTEISNITGQWYGQLKIDYRLSMVSQIPQLDERFTSSHYLAARDGFAPMGLTDMSIAEVASNGCLVLTDDLELSIYLSVIGIDVINFNHLRSYYLFDE